MTYQEMERQNQLLLVGRSLRRRGPRTKEHTKVRLPPTDLMPHNGAHPSLSRHLARPQQEDHTSRFPYNTSHLHLIDELVVAGHLLLVLRGLPLPLAVSLRRGGQTGNIT